jgi:8-oxo-dGTP pyrophosphatase MutT (NUDIX family)
MIHPRIHRFLQAIFNRFGIILHDKEKAYLPWPTAFSTVDIAIVDLYRDVILLGKKRATGKWVIIGGFTDPTSICDEEDAIRELDEETGLTASQSDLRFIGNFKIPDGRYEGTPHAIRTHYFLLNIDSTKVVSVPKDPEIAETRWFSLKDRFALVEKDDPYIQPSHKILIKALQKFIGA